MSGLSFTCWPLGGLDSIASYFVNSIFFPRCVRKRTFDPCMCPLRVYATTGRRKELLGVGSKSTSDGFKPLRLEVRGRDRQTMYWNIKVRIEWLKMVWLTYVLSNPCFVTIYLNVLKILIVKYHTYLFITFVKRIYKFVTLTP